MVRVRRLSSATPLLPQPLTELGVELEYVVQDEEEERDRVAEELYRRDAILQVRAAAAAAGVKKAGGRRSRGEGVRGGGGWRSRVEEEGKGG